MIHIKDVSQLGVYERKVLTFWKNSDIFSRIILKSAIYLLVYLTAIATLSLVLTIYLDRRIVAHYANISLHLPTRNAQIIGLAVKSFVYFMFSFLYIEFRLAKYLKKNIDRIAAMDIDPWPAEKPYEPASLSFMNRPELSGKASTYIDEIMRIDPKTPFTWKAFLRLIRIPIVLIISWLVVSNLLGPILKHIFK